MKETGHSFTSTCCLEEARIAEVTGRTLIASVTGKKARLCSVSSLSSDMSFV